MAGLRTPERGAKHCRNLTPGGHLNLARTGHFYLALIRSGRIRCGYVKTPVAIHRRTAGPSARLTNQNSKGHVAVVVRRPGSLSPNSPLLISDSMLLFRALVRHQQAFSGSCRTGAKRFRIPCARSNVSSCSSGREAKSIRNCIGLGARASRSTLIPDYVRRSLP